MSDFSLTTLFVVPVSNVLPTTGAPAALTAGQFGVFKDDVRTIATAANIATGAFIQFFQGRQASIAAVIGTKPSDKINPLRIKKWFKSVGHGTSTVQIMTIGAFTNVACDTQLTLTIRAHSSYISTVAFNGTTDSVTIQTPCCTCGASPCAIIANETLIDLFIAKLALYGQDGPSAININTFYTFTKVGVGTAAVLTITAKALTAYGQPCDISVNSYEFDRMWFNAFVEGGPATTVDMDVVKPCDSVGTILITQRSSFPSLTSAEVAQLEFDYYSYQSPFKSLFRTSGFNPYFESYVTAGTVYDQYTIKFNDYTPDLAWTSNQTQDETVILMFPTGAGSVVETMLTAYLGAPAVETAGTITTTPVYA